MSLQGIMNIIFGNITVILLAGFGIMFLAKYFKLTDKMKFKVIDRSEVERVKFAERMKLNPSKKYRLFIVGKTPIGKITHFREFNLGNPHTKQFTQMMIKPMLISNGCIQIANPIAKSQCVEIEKKIVRLDKASKHVIVPEGTYFDYQFGMNYDLTDEEAHLVMIKNDNILRTDYDQMAGRYWVKGQQQCVYSPEFALQMALKERELAIELAKKKGKSETI